MKAKGLLRHRFHGTYSAVIVLGFDSPEDVVQALPLLPGFERHPKEPRALMWAGQRDALNETKAVLGTFGADVRKIDSIARSIDHGEPFEVTFP